MKKARAIKSQEKVADTPGEGKLKLKLKRKDYGKALLGLQAELCAVQDWVIATGQRIILVFEGRDAAGKGGTIKAITERVSPRVFRVVALPAPSDREKSQMYIQCYMAHFPAAGEIVIFDRSWYNRAGVERVMGFCTEAQCHRFLELCPFIEKQIVENGILLFKYWLEVGDEEQERRFRARIDDPVRQWKLSPMDLPSRERWYDYSRARPDAGGYRHGFCSLAHRRLRRQEACSLGPDCASPEADSLRAYAKEKDQVAQTHYEACL